MIRTVGIGAGASLFGLVVFLVGAHVNFPGQAALKRARYEVQERSKGDWALDASDAGLWRVSGLYLDDAALYKIEKPKRHRRRGTDTPDEEPQAKVVPVLVTDRVAARLELLPLLRGQRVVDFSANLFGGSLGGSVSPGETQQSLALDAEDIDLSLIPFSGESWEINAVGSASMDADLHMDSENSKNSSGDAHLEIGDLAIESMTIAGFDLGEAKFSEAVMDLKMARGKLDIKKGQFTGDLLSATLSGGATMSNKDPKRWRLRVEVEATLGEELDRLLKNLPTAKTARDNEGTWHFLCTGTVSRPLCRADRSAAGTAPKPSRSKRTVKRGRADTDNPPAMTSEERRERRMERIKARREKTRQAREEGGRPDFDQPEDIRTMRDGRQGERFPRPEIDEDYLPEDDQNFEDGGPYDEDDPPDGSDRLDLPPDVMDNPYLDR